MTTVSQTRLRVALGTFIAIEAEASDEPTARRGVEAAFDAILTVQKLMHPIRGTDLATLAARPPGTPLKMHPWTCEVLELCRQLHHASHGIFDPCLSDAAGRIADLQILPADTVIAHAPLRIDLGGIAKGYAVDRANEGLRAAGCVGGLVNAGGDLAVFGRRSHQIVCGRSGESGVRVELRDAALASSDASDPASLDALRPSEHRGYYDGRGRQTVVTGRATVIAARAAIADGLTKCLLSASQKMSAALLASFGAEQVH